MMDESTAKNFFESKLLHRDPEFRPALMRPLPPGTVIELQEHRPEISAAITSSGRRWRRYWSGVWSSIQPSQNVAISRERKCCARSFMPDLVIEFTAEGEAHD
jgi:hypothetical protein